MFDWYPTSMAFSFLRFLHLFIFLVMFSSFIYCKRQKKEKRKKEEVKIDLQIVKKKRKKRVINKRKKRRKEAIEIRRC